MTGKGSPQEKKGSIVSSPESQTLSILKRSVKQADQKGKPGLPLGPGAKMAVSSWFVKTGYWLGFKPMAGVWSASGL